MASKPAPTPAVEHNPPGGELDRARSPADSRARLEARARRFVEAHAWVLEHHADTFRKLAK